MANPFTQEELELLDGKYAPLAKSIGVSDTYLKNIAKGKSKFRSELSKECLEKLKSAVELYTPKV